MTAEHRHVRTARLDLTALTAADLDALYALHSDPRVWNHLPSGRHTDPQQTLEALLGWQQEWAVDGLGYWVARLHESPTVVAIGGCALPPDHDSWNLYYRVHPDYQGRGIAFEICGAALDAAHAVVADRPVTAYLLAHNEASRAIAIKLGMTEVWRGPDAGNPDPQAVRLVFSDRPVPVALLNQLIR